MASIVAVRKRKQGEGSKHHERGFQSRSQMGMARYKSHSHGASKRQAHKALLKGNGEDVKVVQELMRHANISVTLNIYAQAITQSKRDAQSRVVSLLLDKK
jgi:integrase